ncbi:MAG: hypothetical protein J7500_02510 [Sphingomonas sp.]|uniref:hypothetical protein n=1 Tax=Sphingomonas sp. TaxID=28214 RepID=UPI001B1611A1|nr:hypothetical protein [Sphingomonas sp.]MBO9621562.1 hypothetical protein [Sphingomonas sp.]
MSEQSESFVFMRSLVADGPHPDIPEADRIYAPVIGSWSLTIEWLDSKGDVERALPGEWHFSWVLDGLGVQDVWITPPRSERTDGTPPHEHGTSVRFYDRRTRTWRSTWTGPRHSSILEFQSRLIHDEIVLESRGQTPRMKWVFSDFSADGFTWRNWVEDAGSWWLQQRFIASRIRHA